MKKLLFVLILVTHLVSGVFCQSANSSGPIDLVVLLDTSASMSASYNQTSNYLIGPFLREFLRIGDTFHLISFSGTPKLEISRRIEGVGDVETIIARMLLMYPLDPESNLSGALSFAESFASSLSNRSKKIILISDGDAENTQSLVDGSSARLRGLGADLQYIKAPVTGDGPRSGRAALAQTAPAQTASSQGSQTAQTAQQSSQTAQGTAQAAQTTQSAQTPQQGTQAQQPQTAQTSQPGAQAQPSQTAQQGTQTAQTAQTPEGSAQSSSSSQGTQGASQAGGSQAQTSTGSVTSQESSGAASPAQVQSAGQNAGGVGPASTGQTAVTGQTQSSQSSSGIMGTLPLPLIIALALLLLLVIIGIIIFASRRLDKSPNRVISKAASAGSSESKAGQAGQYTETRRADQVREYPPASMKPLPKDKIYNDNILPTDGSPVLLNLFVADQNTAIGKRNIHSLKPGYAYSIGGGNSDFLIFLVPVPPHIAEVMLDGRNCAFTPKKPEFFPDIGSQTIPNCIGKTFRVISEKKYELHIRLERYEDPLTALNKMLRSIKVPGPVV